MQQGKAAFPPRYSFFLGNKPSENLGGEARDDVVCLLVVLVGAVRDGVEHALNEERQRHVVCAGVEVGEALVEHCLYPLLYLLREEGIAAARKDGVELFAVVAEGEENLLCVISRIPLRLVEELFLPVEVAQNLLKKLVLNLVGKLVDVGVVQVEGRFVYPREL